MQVDYKTLYFLTSAVDSFLETSFVVLRSLIGSLERKSEFFDKLFTCFERYSALIDNSITGPINVDIEALACLGFLSSDLSFFHQP